MIREHLCTIRATQDQHSEKLDMVIKPVGAVERKVADLHSDFVDMSTRVDTLDARLERVERRLDLIPAE